MIGAYITEVTSYSVDCDECDWGEAGHDYHDAIIVAESHNDRYHDDGVDRDPLSN